MENMLTIDNSTLVKPNYSYQVEYLQLNIGHRQCYKRPMTRMKPRCQA